MASVKDIRDSLQGHMAALSGIQYSYGYQRLGLPNTPQADLVYRGLANDIYIDGGSNGIRRVTHRFSAQITLTYKGDNSNTEDQLLTLTQTALDYFDGHKRKGWPSTVVQADLTTAEAQFVQPQSGSQVIYRVLQLDFEILNEENTTYA